MSMFERVLEAAALEGRLDVVRFMGENQRTVEELIEDVVMSHQAASEPESIEPEDEGDSDVDGPSCAVAKCG